MQNEAIPFDPSQDLPALAASGARGGTVAVFRPPRGPDLRRRAPRLA